MSVLVPGAGLGRLAFEFARMGMLGKKGGPALVNCLTARLPESSKFASTTICGYIYAKAYHG